MMNRTFGTSSRLKSVRPVVIAVAASLPLALSCQSNGRRGASGLAVGQEGMASGEVATRIQEIDQHVEFIKPGSATVPPTYPGLESGDLVHDERTLSPNAQSPSDKTPHQPHKVASLRQSEGEAFAERQTERIGQSSAASLIRRAGPAYAEERLQEQQGKGLGQVKGPAFGAVKIPVEINAKVQFWIDYFSVKDRARFQRFLNRGARYRAMISEILIEEQIPHELFYLAMIESGFSTKARSHASAVGVWQFVAATGRRYGLKVNRYVDERQDPVRATRAAAHYLKDLYRVYQSWYLAMAAYNAGERRIMSAIMGKDTRDFWALVQKKALPRETMNYVPKFLAAVIIGQNPERFGFEAPSADQVLDPEVVQVPRRTPLKAIAKLSGIPLKTLKFYNPHLRKHTPPGRKSYSLWVPKDDKGQLVAVLDQLPKHRVRSSTVARYAGGVVKGTHKVRRGQSLHLIAKRHGVSIAGLKKANGLRSSRIYPGQRLKIPGVALAKGGKKYRVRRGDNLGLIARRFGVSIRSLKRMNGLRYNRIYAGQVLKVRGS